jgi:tetratricopeptide (TPR) repeat protein
LYQTGKYAVAKSLLQRALDIQEKALGKAHPSTAKSLNDLAVLYCALGQYSEAEPLFKRVLETYEKVGTVTESPHYAASLNNLAALYRTQGRYLEAEPLYKRALEIYERTLGEEHPDIATSLNGLALLYKSQIPRAVH